jgi:autoinducer 2-degrading protein
LKEEKGCLRFDVLQPIDSDGSLIADCIWLTELYESAEAVKEHEDSPRMPILGEAIGSIVESKRLIKAAII